MRFPSLLLSALALAAHALAGTASPLAAQRVLGPGDDAVTIPRGMLRIGIGGELTIHRDRWRDGTLERLGAGFTFDALGPSQLAVLGPLQQTVRDLGAPGFAASLGASRLDLRQRIFVTPFSLEVGATDWLTVGVEAPLVRVRSEARFRLDGATATLGPNPYFLGTNVPFSNRTTINAFNAAATSLESRRNACIADPASAPECPSIIAEAAQVNALIAGTAAFASGLASTYGGQGFPVPSAYVPMAGSPAALALLARVDSLRTSFTRYGVTDITSTTALPLGAQAPLSAEDLDQLLRDPTSGYGARPLKSSAQLGIGDIDVQVKLKLFDSFGSAVGGATAGRLRADRFGIRQSVGLTYRIGLGTPAAPGDFLDLGTGSGENAIGVRSYTDLVINDRFWTAVALGWAKAQGGDVVVRVPTAPGDQLLEPWREVVATVTRGPVLQAELAPRFHLSDYIAVGGYWGWRHRAADRYDPQMSASAGRAVNPAGMASAIASTEQRAGFSLTFSTLAAQARGNAARGNAARGKVGLGFELSFSHQQSFASSQGIVPKAWEDRLQLRYYTRLFGR